MEFIERIEQIFSRQVSGAERLLEVFKDCVRSELIALPEYLKRQGGRALSLIVLVALVGFCVLVGGALLLVALVLGLIAALPTVAPGYVVLGTAIGVLIIGALAATIFVAKNRAWKEQVHKDFESLLERWL